MIKTLRVTSAAAIIVAGLVLVSVFGPASLFGDGAQDDRQLARILGAPSAVDRFKDQLGNKPPIAPDTPPLVKQAELLAKIINPPADTSSPSENASLPPIAKRPALPVSPSTRFTIAGLSYCPSDPTQSFAFLRLVDGTYRWVRPGDEIGHHVVKAIRNSSIVCWDGSQESEMPMEPPPDTAGLLETGGGSSAAAASEPQRPAGARAPAYSPAVRSKSPAPLTQSDQQRLSDLMSRIKQAGADPAARAKLIAEYQASRVSPQEAEKLDDLGKEVSGDDARANQPPISQ